LKIFHYYALYQKTASTTTTSIDIAWSTTTTAGNCQHFRWATVARIKIARSFKGVVSIATCIGYNSTARDNKSSWITSKQGAVFPKIINITSNKTLSCHDYSLNVYD
jgi:hypothetical protein